MSNYTKEIKSIPFEVKINEAKREIEGYASTFGNKDLVGDAVMPGAFKKTIKERFPKKQIKVLWQHYEPLGIPKHMEEDSKGLYVVSHISKTQLGNDALELAADGVIDRMSIGYDVIKDFVNEEQQIRELKELKLYEYSLVTFPANEEAVIQGVKSLKDLDRVLQNTGGADFTRLLKEGRMLSKPNLERIKNAITALQDILAIAEPEDETSTQKNIIQNVDPDTLQSILAFYKNYGRNQQ